VSPTHYIKHAGGWTLAMATGIGVWCFLPLEPAARHCFAIILVGIVCFIFDLLPNYIVGIWITILPVILGITPADVALKATTQWAWWIILIGFMIGIAFNKTGLGNRFGLYFGATIVKGWFTVILSIFLMNIFFNILAPFSGAAAIAIGISIFMPIAHDMGFKPGDNGFNGIALACVTSNLLAGELVLTGWPINPLAVTLFSPYFQLDFMGWIKYITVPASVLVIVGYLAVALVFKPRQPVFYDSKSAKKQLQALPRISIAEVKTLFITLLILLAFITQPLHGLEAGWLALGFAFLFFVPIIGVLDSKEFSTQLPWHFFMFLLGLFSIGYQLNYHNIHIWLAQSTMANGIETWHPILANVYISGLMTLMHFVVGSMVPLLASFIPTLASYASDYDMPLIMTFGAVLFSSKRWIFPFQEAFVLMTQGLTGGKLETRAIIKLGAVLTILIILVVIPISTLYWKLIGAP